MSDTDSRPGHRGTILLVDDTLYIRIMLKKVLEPLGYEIIEAGDGVEAENLFIENEENIDLILCDIGLPEQDGVVTLSHIRQRNSNVPVIMLTANTKEEYLVTCAKLGISGFFAKPVDHGKLRAKVQEVLIGEGTQGKGIQMNQVKILILDPLAQVRVLLRELLLARGVQVRDAESITEAGSLLTQYRPELILMNLSQPTVLGEHEIIGFKLGNQLEDVTVIGYRSHLEEGAKAKEEQIEEGSFYVGVLPFPFSFNDLSNLIKNLQL